jgi:hypothetical protein
MAKKVKSLEQKQADSRRVKAMAAAGMLGVATIFGAAACKHPPDPKLCTCPNGTVHPYGTTMPCCNGQDDCNCTVQEQQKPNFEDFFDVQNYSGEDRDSLIQQIRLAYNALNTGYVMGLKSNYVTPISIELVPNDSVNSNVVTYNADGIGIYGNPAMSAAILQSVLEAYIENTPLRLTALRLNNKQFLALGKRATQGCQALFFGLV